jgi:hypothetical protein
MKTTFRHLAVALLASFCGSAIPSAHAALGGASGIVIPYAGKLELDGALVTGTINFEFKVLESSTTLVVCQTKEIPDVPVTNGEFAVTIPGVSEACVKGKDVHLQIAVKTPDSNSFVVLGKQRVTPVLGALTSGTGDFAVTDRLTAKSLTVVDPAVSDAPGINITTTKISAVGPILSTQNITLQPKDGQGGSGRVEVQGPLTASSLSTSALSASSVVVRSPDNIGTTNIADFKALNQTQGVGIGFNTVRATGSNAAVDLFLEGKGTGVVVVNDDLEVNGSFSSPCRAGFTAIDGGRICISTVMQPRGAGGAVGSPVPMQDRADAAIRACRAQRAHVCTHTDIQQVCGNFLADAAAGISGLNPYSEIGTGNLWYGDLVSNDIFMFNSSGPDFTVCRADADNQSAGPASGSAGVALYRCCY